MTPLIPMDSTKQNRNAKQGPLRNSHHHHHHRHHRPPPDPPGRRRPPPPPPRRRVRDPRHEGRTQTLPRIPGRCLTVPRAARGGASPARRPPRAIKQSARGDPVRGTEGSRWWSMAEQEDGSRRRREAEAPVVALECVAGSSEQGSPFRSERPKFRYFFPFSLLTWKRISVRKVGDFGFQIQKYESQTLVKKTKFRTVKTKW